MIFNLKDYRDIEDIDFQWFDDMETEENLQYMKDNWHDIIDREEQDLTRWVEEGVWSFDTINDNQGECIVCNEEGEELCSFHYYATVNCDC